MGVYVEIDKYVDRILGDVMSGDWAGEKVSELIVIVKVSLTIYILYKGFLILAGKTQEPVRDLLWDLGSKAFILCALFGSREWVEFTQEICKGLWNWAGYGIERALENYSTIFDNLSRWDISSKASWAAAPFIAFAMYVCALIGTAIPFFAYLMAKVSMFLLMSLAPVAIFLRFYGFLKNGFTQWVQLLFSSLLSALMLGLVMFNISSKVLELQNNYIAKSKYNAWDVVAEFCLYCLLMAFFAKLVASIAQSMAQVSLESAASGAASGAIGAGVGAASKVAKGTAKLLKGSLKKLGGKSGEKADGGTDKLKDMVKNKIGKES